MVSSFPKVAAAALTSFLSYPSLTQVHRSVLPRFSLHPYRRNQSRSFYSPDLATFFSTGNIRTRLAFEKKNVSSSSTQDHQKETNLKASSVSTSPRGSSASVAWISKYHQIRAQKSLAKLLASSKLGLDPSLNRFHAPLVYHDGYSAIEWPTRHTFPMMKFERLSHALLTTTSKTHATSNLPRPIVRTKDDYYRPPDFSVIPIEEWLDLLNKETDSDDFASRARACPSCRGRTCFS